MLLFLCWLSLPFTKFCFLYFSFEFPRMNFCFFCMCDILLHFLKLSFISKVLVKAYCPFALYPRWKGTSPTMGLDYMSLFLRRHLFILASMTSIYQRWLWEKHWIFPPVARVLEAEQVINPFPPLQFQVILAMISAKKFKSNTYFIFVWRTSDGTGEERARERNSSWFWSGQLHEGGLLSAFNVMDFLDHKLGVLGQWLNFTPILIGHICWGLSDKSSNWLCFEGELSLNLIFMLYKESFFFFQVSYHWSNYFVCHLFLSCRFWLSNLIVAHVP